MRSTRRTLKGPSVLPKTQRNRVVLFRIRFTTIWGSEIHISLKFDAHALNRRRRRLLLCTIIHHICQGQWRQYARKCACVYDICTLNWLRTVNDTSLLSESWAFSKSKPEWCTAYYTPIFPIIWRMQKYLNTSWAITSKYIVMIPSNFAYLQISLWDKILDTTLYVICI
jgi:hypothetical protein